MRRGSSSCGSSTSQAEACCTTSTGNRCGGRSLRSGDCAAPGQQAWRQPSCSSPSSSSSSSRCCCSQQQRCRQLQQQQHAEQQQQPQLQPAPQPWRRRQRRGASTWLALLALGLLAAACGPPRAAAASDRPLQLAIVNQVHFHLEVVAGAMAVLKQMTSAPVTVYLPAKVLKTNWYGFINWLGGREGFVWKECKEYDGSTKYDLAWFISPEYQTPWVAAIAKQMAPAVGMFMVHNGHIPDEDFNRVKAAAAAGGGLPLLTLAPHVAKNISGRAGPLAPQWILPIFPYTPANACTLEDLQAGRVCLKGFSVQGRIERSRRNYTQMWEQISSYRAREGASALSNFRLNILGEVVEAFTVPPDVRDLVAVYKNPPYPIFYDVVYHSYALVPMLASKLYYMSKFSSTVLTSFITGTPMITDSRFMAAYSMIEPNAVFFQEDGQNELDVMFAVARSAPEEMWRTRLGLKEMRGKMNARARDMILGWLKDKGLKPDAKSELGKAAAGKRAARRALLSPLWLLAHSLGQQLEDGLVGLVGAPHGAQHGH